MKLVKNPTDFMEEIHNGVDIDNILLQASPPSTSSNSGFLNYRGNGYSKLLSPPKRQKLNLSSQRSSKQSRKRPSSSGSTKNSSKASSNKMKSRQSIGSREEFLQQNGFPVFQWTIIFAVIGAGLWYSCFKGTPSSVSNSNNKEKWNSKEKSKSSDTSKSLRKNRSSKRGKNDSRSRPSMSRKQQTGVLPNKSKSQRSKVKAEKAEKKVSPVKENDLELKVENETSSINRREIVENVSQEKIGPTKSNEASNDTKILEEPKSLNSDLSAPDSTSTDGSSVFDSDDEGEWHTVGSKKEGKQNINTSSTSTVDPVDKSSSTAVDESKANTIDEEKDDESPRDSIDDEELARKLQEQENAAAFGLKQEEDNWEQVTTKKKRSKKNKAMTV